MTKTNIEPKVFPYDTGKYNFRKMIADQLQESDLEHLHQHSDNYDKVFERKNDQSTIWHKRFYQIGPHFFETYENFVRDVIKPIFGEGVVYQKIPSFRVHYHKNLGVGEFHRDRDYAHNMNEVNFWLPVTRAFDTNTIWIESEEGKEDFHPLECKVGEFWRFNGCHLKHGNKINATGQTRVSFDFRVIPRSLYSEDHVGKSINMKVEFKIGGYYKLME